MKIDEGFIAQMREAARILQSDGPMAATAAIQRALHGTGAPGPGSPEPNQERVLPREPELRDINPPPASATASATATAADDVRSRLHKFSDKWKDAMAKHAVVDVDARENVDLAGKGRYLSGSCTNAAGTRSYKLYVPSSYSGQALPLIVMLHGCTQHPDDFAAGTDMNAVAEKNNCFVLYPCQSQSANGSKCWNWFNTADQQRDKGEPSIIADMTRQVIREYKIDADRVYAAGLSAGGAMAAILAATYPDLYAAIGVHSGLPYAVAHDMPSAFAAMKNRRGKVSSRRTATKVKPLAQDVPVIVFHGDRDSTVDLLNAEQVLRQCSGRTDSANGEEGRATTEQGQVADGHRYTRWVLHGESGAPVAEKWTVHGAAHAWSGGSRNGTYTDRHGPDASTEMVRFFLACRRSSAVTG